ncbi:MAG: gluconate 2-dehydrogenase subunit 3 family protein [Cyclobacteriaceae bacterium]
MKRREALQKAGFMFGGTIAGGSLLFQAGFRFNYGDGEGFFNKAQIRFLNEVGETILPESDTPGAKEANVGEFMSVVVRDCYAPQNQKIFIDGMDKLNILCKHTYQKLFVECNSAQRTELLSKLDKEGSEYFKLMKSLTLTGYFTSKLGATQFLNYSPAPGRYEGCTTERPW